MDSTSNFFTNHRVDICHSADWHFFTSLGADIMSRQDKLHASVQRLYEDLCQDSRELTLRIKIVEKAQGQQGALPDVSKLIR